MARLRDDGDRPGTELAVAAELKATFNTLYEQTDLGILVTELVNGHWGDSQRTLLSEPRKVRFTPGAFTPASKNTWSVFPCLSLKCSLVST
ncbi:MAG: hypothetical protein AAF938_05840 [Myxococcota bacterium]